ncbi:MAG TPA: glycosyltransferase family 87 protein, partial [Caulobacteraceae bacterium]|nr:glycosyltransferase family 87 protein [Caulobacteraceae bacterium]
WVQAHRGFESHPVRHRRLMFQALLAVTMPPVAPQSMGLSRPYRLAQAALVVVALYCAVTIDVQGVVRSVILEGRYVGDFTVFWTAPRIEPSQVYDLEAISQAQGPLLGGPKGARPFVNPPSLLPWLEPFGAMPFFVAFAAWVCLGLAAFAAACRKVVSWRHAPLIILAPPFVLGVVAGQVSLLVAAAVVAALANLKARPILAGALLGVAATLKPQALVLAPIALAAGGHWRALAAALVAGLAVGSACVLVQGVDLWMDWWRALEQFAEIGQRYYLMKRGATPSNLAYQLGLTGAAAAVLINGLRVFGIFVVIAVFRWSEDLPDRIAGLVAGSLLVVPYAMPPEAIPLLVPASLWLLGADKRLWTPGFLLVSQLLLPVAVIAMAVAAFLRAVSGRELSSNLRWDDGGGT